MKLTGLVVLLVVYTVQGQRYEPTWESLDARPFPPWYDDAKIGIFIHWGVFSVPSFGSEWFWNSWKENSSSYIEFMEKNYPPGFSYQDFAKDFTAEFYNPDQWADLFAASGARYIVLTSKHHEGYTLWPSKNSFSWNSVDVGPHRDLLGELAQSLRSRTNLTFGLYHSLYEWYNPLYLQDKQNNFATKDFVTTKTMPELYDLVNTYKPEIIWSDGDWETTEDYWGSKEFIAWLYNDSPVKDTVLTNDRWGSNIPCNHGGYFTCADRYSPGVLQPRKWENCMTIDGHSWGYRRNAQFEDYLTTKTILTELVKTVSCGGNLLLNVGPTKEGTITAIYEERLRQMGDWLKVNGEAIYGSSPWTYQNDTKTSGVWFTKSDDAVYASVTNWPSSGSLELNTVELGANSTVYLLGYPDRLSWVGSGTELTVDFPRDAIVLTEDTVYVLKMINVHN